MDRIGSGRRLEPETDGFLFLRVKAIKLNELNEGMKTDNSLTHPPAPPDIQILPSLFSIPLATNSRSSLHYREGTTP